MAGDDEQRQPLLGNESQGDYGASTSGGAPPAAEGESREAMEAREIAYACKTGPGGLTSAEAAERLERYGPNVLEEPQRNELLVFLGFFWGPMPFMIWIATIVVGIERDWEDVTVLLVLQLVNGTVGYFEERSAGDAISALKKSLAPKASVKRDGRFTTIEAKGGYGLSLESEQKSMQALADAAALVPLNLKRTFLGAHEFPPEYREDRDEYVRVVCEEMIPALAPMAAGGGRVARGFRATGDAAAARAGTPRGGVVASWPHRVATNSYAA